VNAVPGATQELHAGAGAGLVPRLRQFAEAIKLRIGLEIALAAVAGAAVVPGGPGSGARVALVTLAVLLSACAAGAYNQYAEADIDALMKRTRRRPFVTGEFRADARWPWLIAVTLIVAVALAAWAANRVAATWVLLGAVTYGIVYTVWLKRRTWLNIVVGGFAGTFAFLAGAAAVDPHPSPEAALLGIALFFWTPPHFWSLALYHKADYAAAGVPMLPVLLPDRATALVIAAHVLVVAAASVGAAFIGLGPVFLAAALAGSAWFLTAAIRLVRQPDRGRALSCFRASLGQLTLLLVGAIADGVAAGRL
jgi:protoheme IX farnesyltransferase